MTAKETIHPLHCDMTNLSVSRNNRKFICLNYISFNDRNEIKNDIELLKFNRFGV